MFVCPCYFPLLVTILRFTFWQICTCFTVSVQVKLCLELGYLIVNVVFLFCLGAVSSLGKEQFLALYLSAGVISSFTSYFYKVVTKQSGLSLGAVSIVFVCAFAWFGYTVFAKHAWKNFYSLIFRSFAKRTLLFLFIT